MLMKVALYARVSTMDQDCAMQLREMREFVARQGWTIAREYVDRGESGSKASRPRLNALMADAARKRFGAVLVWKLDRFGRSVAQVLANVTLLDSYGVRFVSVTQSIDSDHGSPMGRFLLHLFASLAELERGMILERVNAGIANAQALGKHCGRPRKVFRRDEAIRLHAAGESVRMIASKLGVSSMTIQRCIKTHA